MKTVLIAAVLFCAGCGVAENAATGRIDGERSVVRVTGELRSANSTYFSPPAIPGIWRQTISFMAPDGAIVGKDDPVLRFDTLELRTKMRTKRNALNEKRKEFEKQQILSRDLLADSKMLVEEARAALDKAALKADIPESLLASRDYRENQLLLEQARLVYAQRTEELAKDETIQAIESEVLEREIAVLQSEVDILRGSIDSLEMRAPGPGVVVHTTDRRHNKSSVGDMVHAGHRIIELPDLEKLEAHLEIPERESARVQIGQSVNFTLEAVPDKRFEGQITELASVVHTRSLNQPAKVFDATVKLTNPDAKLMRPGMSINAQIHIEDSGDGR